MRCDAVNPQLLTRRERYVPPPHPMIPSTRLLLHGQAAASSLFNLACKMLKIKLNVESKNDRLMMARSTPRTHSTPLWTSLSSFALNKVGATRQQALAQSLPQPEAAQQQQQQQPAAAEESGQAEKLCFLQ